MIEKFIRLLEQIAMAIAVLCVVAIMVIVSVDAIARYALNAPLPWAFELVTYYLMVMAVYGALSATFTHGDHVSITFIQDSFPQRLRATLGAISAVLAAGVFAVIAYGSWHNVAEAYVRQEFLPGYIVWPAWLSQLPVPIGCILIALRLLCHAVILLRDGHDESVATFHDMEEIAE